MKVDEGSEQVIIRNGQPRKEILTCGWDHKELIKDINKLLEDHALKLKKITKGRTDNRFWIYVEEL